MHCHVLCLHREVISGDVLSCCVICLRVIVIIAMICRDLCATVNPDHDGIYGDIAECRRKFRGMSMFYFMFYICLPDFFPVFIFVLYFMIIDDGL